MDLWTMGSPQALPSTSHIMELNEYLAPGFCRALESQGFLEGIWECSTSLGGGRGWGER